MVSTLKSIFSVVILASALAFAGLADAAADRRDAEESRGIKNFLTENTLAYPDEKGEENLIHFGRFGNFDWYFPCQFESGYWNLDRDLVLSLTYDNPEFQPREYQLARREGAITLTEPGSGGIMVAKLLEGSHIPFF